MRGPKRLVRNLKRAAPDAVQGQRAAELIIELGAASMKHMKAPAACESLIIWARTVLQEGGFFDTPALKRSLSSVKKPKVLETRGL